MQLKIAGAIAVLCLVVASLAVAGCTTSQYSSTPTPAATTPTAANNAVSDPTAQINTAFAQQGVIVTPFTKGSADGYVTYTGTVKDGSDRLTTEQHNITYILCPTREDALAQVKTQSANAATLGYVHQGSLNETLYWFGYKGDLSDNNGPKVMINACEPDQMCEVGLNHYTGVSFDSFVVCVDYYNGGM